MKIPVISSWLERRAAETELLKRILSDAPAAGHAGVSVTPDSAMRTSAVWACVRVLSTGMGALPLHVYRDSPLGGKEKAKDIPVYNMLHRAPNPEQASFIFRQTAMAHICLWGNAYAEIQFDNFGQPIALWPIPPWCCRPLRTQDKQLFYQVTMPDSGEPRNLQPYRIWHVMGLGTDGMKGLSPIRQMMETLGISIAAEQFGAMFFGKGTNVGGIVEHPKTLTDLASGHLVKQLNEKYGGLSNAFRLILLEEGMKYQKVGIPPEEAQFIETRQFQIEDVARIFGVQQHKIGHLLHATFSNIEHQGIEFVTDTMLPWTVNFEQEYDRKLLPDGLYTKHSLEGLLRGDTAARATFYKELFYLGSLSPDEIREKEDMNPEPDDMGKRYYIQGNMVPADRIDAYVSSNASKTVPGRDLLIDAVRRIASREKQNILRAAKKNDGPGMTVFITDFYRDFPEYIERQVEPFLGDKASDFTKKYVEASKIELADLKPEMAETVLANWEENKVNSYWEVLICQR